MLNYLEEMSEARKFIKSLILHEDNFVSMGNV